MDTLARRLMQWIEAFLERLSEMEMWKDFGITEARRARFQKRPLHVYFRRTWWHAI